jgi:hypothetical protein
MFWLALILLLSGITLFGIACYLYAGVIPVRSEPADRRLGIYWLISADPHAASGYLALVGVLCLLASVVILVLARPYIPVF